MAKKILVVDDEKLIVKGIRFSLEQDSYEVDAAYDGEEGLEKAKSGQYDLILLDLMLPKMSGLEVCQQIREFSDVPVIMLTAKGEDMDKILGLEYGADDYITKPFNILELKARIKARENRRLSISGREINLTSKEFELLDFLVSNPGKVYSRTELLHIIWGKTDRSDERTVDVHVRRLREKIEPNPSEPVYVQTKWGVGYFYQEHHA